jgi:hypothetical protein
MFHRGPGTIVYERDVAKRVDEDEYRRHHVVMGFVVVGIGLMLWYYAAGAYNKLANPDKKANNTAT